MSTARIAAEYKKYVESSVMGRLARHAHGKDYCGQTSSATFSEVIDALAGLGVPAGGRILDAGCGNGCFALLLARDHGYEVDGVDVSADLVRRAEEESAALGLFGRCRFHVQDFFETGRFSGAMDAVLCVGSLYWNPEIDRTLAAWKRALRPRGSLVIFANVKVADLTEDEQAAVGWTSFIPEAVLLDALRGLGFTLRVEDRTETYGAWLDRWCEAMHAWRAQLDAEMGEIEAGKVVRRFQAYRDLARERKVIRLVLTASLEDRELGDADQR